MLKNAKKKKERKAVKGFSAYLSPLLFLVMAAFALSSGILGYQLGHSGGSTGELLDTIVLSPGEGGPKTTHFLSGRVRYADGSACRGKRVRMGDGKEDTTDSLGKFYFSDVRSGEAFLEVLEGSESIAHMPILLNFSEGGQASAEITADGSFLELPENTRMLEMTVQLEEDGSLTLQQDASYLVTTEGTVVDFSGGMLSSKETAYSVTPGGNVVASPGYVVLLSQETVLPPQGEAREEETGEVISGLVLNGDQSAETEEGVCIRPDGTVQMPDGQETGGSDGIVVIEGDSSQELVELPERYPAPSPTPEVSSSAEETSPTPGPQGEEPGTGPDVEPSPAIPLEEATPELTATPEPTATPKPTPGALEVTDARTGLSWTQLSTVDLFRNTQMGFQEANTGNGDSVPVIAPGSEGYYDFVLENSEEYGIDFTVRIIEQSFHLPIVYSVQDLGTQKYYMLNAKTGEATQEEGSIAISTVRLKPHARRSYRFSWEWQYKDRYTYKKDDVLDTQAAQNVSIEGRTYLLGISIDAQQVIPAQEDNPDSGTRYPGKK